MEEARPCVQNAVWECIPVAVKHCPLRGLSDVDGRKKMKSILEQLAKMKKEDWERMHANNE